MRLILVWMICLLLPLASLAAQGFKAGVGRDRITPPLPFWLTGYASRTNAAGNVNTDLWAKALALEDPQGQRLVLLTTDLIGLPRELCEAVAEYARQRHHLPRSAVLLNSSHTHAGPAAKTYRVDSRGVDKIARTAHLLRLRRTMTEHAGVIRNARGLETALAALRSIESEATSDSMVANMAVAAQLIAGAALLRRESRGAHFRSDFPNPDPALAKRSVVTLADIATIDAHGRRNKKPARAFAGLPL